MDEYYVYRHYPEDSVWVACPKTTAFLLVSGIAFIGWVGYLVIKLIAALGM